VIEQLQSAQIAVSGINELNTNTDLEPSKSFEIDANLMTESLGTIDYFLQNSNTKSIQRKILKNSFIKSDLLLLLKKFKLEINIIILKPIIESCENQEFELIINKKDSKNELIDDILIFKEKYMISNKSYLKLIGLVGTHFSERFPLASDLNDRKIYLNSKLACKQSFNGCFFNLMEKMEMILTILSKKILLNEKNTIKVNLFSVFIEKYSIRYLFFSIYEINESLLFSDYFIEENILGVFGNETREVSPCVQNFRDSLKNNEIVIENRSFFFIFNLNIEKTHKLYIDSFLNDLPAQEILELNMKNKICYKTVLERKNRIEIVSLLKKLK